MISYPHLCPVCKCYEFVEPYEDCPICGWCNDTIQESEPNWKGCGNSMSLNEAKQAYAEGRQVV